VQMLFERIDQPDMPPERRLFSGDVLHGDSAHLGRV
jgi:hypothetical protein